MFLDLFTQPEYLLKLYQVLHPEDVDVKESDLEIITLQSILMNGIYNDLGFLAGDRLMILVEAQSAWSPNIIIRSLMYLMSTYQDYFHQTDARLYGTAPVRMPRPELYVVYTGEKGNHPDEISLQDTFFSGEACCIEAKAKVIYLNDTDGIINQYIGFCIVLNKEIESHGRTLTAIKNTIRICKERNLLSEYLTRREMEVEGIMLTLFDQDWVTRQYGEDKKTEGVLSAVLSMLRKGRITENEAAEEAGMTVAEFKKAVASMG